MNFANEDEYIFFLYIHAISDVGLFISLIISHIKKSKMKDKMFWACIMGLIRMLTHKMWLGILFIHRHLILKKPNHYTWSGL